MAFYKPYEIFQDNTKKAAVTARLIGGPLTYPANNLQLDSLWISDLTTTVSWYPQTEYEFENNAYLVRGDVSYNHPGNGTDYNIYGLYFIFEDQGDRSYCGHVSWNVPVKFRPSDGSQEIPLSLTIQN